MSDKKSLGRGTGLVERLLDGFPKWQRQRLLQSYCVQPPDEKKARLKLVQELSLELAEVRKTERFTLFGESAIEAVIEGDWKGVADRIGWLTFHDEPAESRERLGAIWARFRELLRAACVEVRYREDLMVRRCATCWAYAETPAKGNIVLRRRSRPKAADRERWGVAATCEEQAVAEVHAL